MDKTALKHKILTLEGLTNEEKSALLELLNKEKKYGLDTPQDIYDQLQYLENEWLGCDVPDEEYTAVIMGDEERTDLTIDEFLEGDNIWKM